MVQAEERKYSFMKKPGVYIFIGHNDNIFFQRNFECEKVSKEPNKLQKQTHIKEQKKSVAYIF